MNHKPHRAFSLTELIIVLVIIALLFAALAPIITKRHIADSAGTENIWNFVNNDTERNAYFDPGYEGWSSSLHVGIEPSKVEASHRKKAGKLVISAGEEMEFNGETYHQPHLQFRFSPDRFQLSNGIDAGCLSVESGGNINLGEIHKPIGDNNTFLGFSAAHEAEEAEGAVAIGTGALEMATLETAKTNENYVTAVGTNAGTYANNNNVNGSGIYIGAGAGVGYSSSDIGIGYHAFFSNETVNAHNNVALGVNAGISPHNGELEYAYNVLVNNTVNTNGGMKYNTIIGPDSYSSKTVSVSNPASDYLNYITAIGYSACASIKPGTGYNTCIGYRSGAESNGASVSASGYTTPDEHVFLGGVPKGFNGRGVMEVHTYSSTEPGDAGLFADSVDVVFNSNLVIRGKLYSYDAESDTPMGYKFIDSFEEELPAADRNPLEPKYYRCTKDNYETGLLLVYNVYVCTDKYETVSGKEQSVSYPRTINVLYKDGSAEGDGVVHSDIRLKDKIVENKDGLQKLLLLQPYNYTFKQDTLGTPQVGVIAQDLQKVFPASVSKDEKGFLKIRWDEMFYAMINSIKELSQKVEETVQKVAELSKNIVSVKSQQKDIRKKISSLDERVKRLERK